VKPGSSTEGLGWAPAQACFYASLFRDWRDQDNSHAHESIQGLLNQRYALGLEKPPKKKLKKPLEIVPIVLIGGRITSPVALPNLVAVRDRLATRSETRWSEFEVWRVPGVERI
jgi:hypothetical protein